MLTHVCAADVSNLTADCILDNAEWDPQLNPMTAAGAQGMLGRVFKAAVQLLDEGREETRVYAKRVLWAVAQLSSVTEPGGFDRMLKGMSSKLWLVLWSWKSGCLDLHDAVLNFCMPLGLA